MIQPTLTRTAREIVCAASDRQFRIPPGAALYKDVVILREGKYEPSYPPGVWEVTPEKIARIAATYDPNFYVATLNTDHDNWWGPAQGVILSVRIEREEGKAILVGDVAITSWWLGQEIDAGMWPSRSPEVWDAEMFGRPCWIEYPDKADYLLGLAALGQAEPAIPNMGPWPVPIVDQPAEEPGEPIFIAFPVAAKGSERRRGIQLKPVPTGGTEMNKDGTAVSTAAADPQAGTAAAVQAQQNTTPPASAPPAPVAAAGGNDAVTAAFEARLSAAEAEAKSARAEAEAVKAARNADLAEHDVRERLRAHRASGRLTVQGQPDAYTRLALQLHATPAPGAITLANGATLQAEQSPLDDLDTIIKNFPAQAHIGNLAAEDPGRSDIGAGSLDSVRAQAIADETAKMEAKRRAEGAA